MNVLVCLAGVETTVELSQGTSTAGGGHADEVQLPGLPARWLLFYVDGDRAVVEGRQPFEIAGRRFPAGQRRLVMPGETIAVDGGGWIRFPTKVTTRHAPTVAAVRSLLNSAPIAPSRTLLCLTGLDLGRELPVVDGVAELGRAETVDLRIRDRHVSRRHAALTVAEGAATIEAFSSANGVRVNGARIRNRHPLSDGDLIELGSTVLSYRAPAPGSSEAEPLDSSEAEPVDSSRAESRDPCSAPNEQPLEIAFHVDAPRRRSRYEAALLAAGVGLALAGTLVTWTVSRESEPAPRDPPAAPSAGGGAQRSW